MHRKLVDWYHLSISVAEASVDIGNGAIACWTRTGKTFSRGTLLKLLRNGHRQWNRWRWNLPNIEWYSVSGRHFWVPGFVIRLPKCDLRSLDLANCEFAGVDFTESSFARANLTSACFDGLSVRPVFQPRAVLNGCNFRGANLAGAIFDRMDAIGCDFSHAELNGTRIHGSDLTSCKFYRTMLAARFDNTNLASSNFQEAYLLSTTFIDVDLGTIEGLNRAHAYPPLTIDARALVKSGALPKNIYRACGIDDTLAENIKGTVGHGHERVRCFISYSTRDEKFVTTLKNDLESNGIETWYAPRDLPIGAKTRTGLDEAIFNSDKVVIVLSRKSIVSNWVEQEVETALDRERVTKRLILLPVRIDESIMKAKAGWAANLRRTRNIGNFSKHGRDAQYFSVLGQLINDIRS